MAWPLGYLVLSLSGIRSLLLPHEDEQSRGTSVRVDVMHCDSSVHLVERTAGVNQ